MFRFNSTFKCKSRPRLWVGKKTLANMKAHAKTKKRFAALGITTCELGYEGCWKDNALSIAHGRKRRKLVGDELETLTILCCIPCHEIIERMTPEAMLAIVQSVIADRGL